MQDYTLSDDDHGALPLLFGRVLDGKGGGRPIAWDEVQDWHPAAEGEVLWIHLLRTHPGVEQWLKDALGMPEPTAELLTSDATRPRAFREGGALVATLRGINFNPGAEPEDMLSMQLWSDGLRVVTLRRLPLQTPRMTCNDVDAGHGPADAGALVTSLTEHLIDRMSHAIIDMNEAIDELEDNFARSRCRKCAGQDRNYPAQLPGAQAAHVAPARSAAGHRQWRTVLVRAARPARDRRDHRPAAPLSR